MISNIFNIGEVSGTTVGSCIGGATAKNNVSAAFYIKEYEITAGQTLVDEAQMASGEVAYKLGDAFGQKIGTDSYPVLGGEKVLYDVAADNYYNDSTTSIDGITIDGTPQKPVYFNLEGIASDKPYSGFNIVRYPDGTVRKVHFR